MDKLEHLRKVCLVRVSGELVAAEKLAEQKASFSEATERLERLQELAGKFRRTQQSIEEKLEDPEAVATVQCKSVEFFTAYHAAKELLENHITNTTPVRAVTRKSSSGSLLAEIRQFCKEVKEWNAVIVGQFRTVPGDPNGSVRESSCALLSDPTTTNNGQSGAVGCGDPDGKKKLSCASTPDPTMVSTREVSYTDSEGEHMPPGQGACGGEVDGPETPTDGVEMASADSKPEEVGEAVINMTVVQDPKGAQWKALMHGGDHFSYIAYIA